MRRGPKPLSNAQRSSALETVIAALDLPRLEYTRAVKGPCSDLQTDRCRIARYLLAETDMPVLEIGRILGLRHARLGKGIFKI